VPGQIVRRLGVMLGRRGAILLCYGAVWALYGYAQIASPPPDQRGLQPLLQLWSLDVWGGLWVAAGLLAMVSAWLPTGRDWMAFPALQLVVLPWMGCYLATWLMGQYPRGWIAAAVWGLISVPVWVVAGWPEPPRAKRVRASAA
jgi:hypothetical protein